MGSSRQQAPAQEHEASRAETPGTGRAALGRDAFDGDTAGGARAASGAVGTAGARDLLRLQRMVGNRGTVQLLGRASRRGSRRPLEAGAISAVARSRLQRKPLRGMANVISGPRGAPLDAEQGQRLLARLAKGDFGAFAGLEGAPPHSETTKMTFDNMDDFLSGNDPLTQEWGLARDDTGEVHIVAGKGKAVQWGPVLAAGAVPLAHSHPFSGGQKNPRRRAMGAPASFAAVVASTALRNLILPSEGDVAFCARERLALHTVQTPYVYDFTSKTVTDPGETPPTDDRPRLSFQIRDAVLVDAGTVEAHLDARANTKLVWTALVRCPEDGTASANFAFLDRSS